MPYKFKVQFEDEDHTISNPPPDLKSLLKLIPKVFKSLPTSRTLKYRDSQSDFVTLTNQEGYQAMIDSDEENKTKTRKIMIVPAEENQQPEKSFGASTLTTQGTKKKRPEAINTKADKTQNRKAKPVSSDDSEDENESESESDSETSEEGENLTKPQGKVNLQKSITDMSFLDQTTRTALKEDTKLKIEDLAGTKKEKVVVDSEEEDDSEDSSSDSSEDDIEEPVKPTKNSKASNSKESLNTKNIQNASKNGVKASKVESKVDDNSEDIDFSSLRRQIRDDFNHVVELAMQGIKEYVHKSLEEHMPPKLFQQKDKKIKEQNKLLESLSANAEQMRTNLISINKRFEEESVAQTKFLKELEEKVISKPALEPLKEKSANIPKDPKKKTSKKKVASSDSDDSDDSPVLKKSKPKKEPSKIDLSPDSPSIIPKPKSRTQKNPVVESSNLSKGKPQKPKTPAYNVAFSGEELRTMPPEIRPNLRTVSKPIMLSNTGTDTWPKGCTFETFFGAVGGEPVKIPSLEPGAKPFSAMLCMNGPKEPGQFVVGWKLGYRDSSGKKHEIGEPFFLTLNVLDREADEDDGARMVDSDSVEEEKKPNNGSRINIRQEVENMDEIIAKKVRQIKSLKRDVDEEVLLTYLTEDPKMPIEALLESLGIVN